MEDSWYQLANKHASFIFTSVILTLSFILSLTANTILLWKRGTLVNINTTRTEGDYFEEDPYQFPFFFLKKGTQLNSMRKSYVSDQGTSTKTKLTICN